MMDSRKNDTPLRVGISGSYGGFNLGDEAILQVILDELRRSTPIEITVFSRDVTDTRRRHRVEHVVELRGTPRREAQESSTTSTCSSLAAEACSTTGMPTCTCARLASRTRSAPQ